MDIVCQITHEGGHTNHNIYCANALAILWLIQKKTPDTDNLLAVSDRVRGGIIRT